MMLPNQFDMMRMEVPRDVALAHVKECFKDDDDKKTVEALWRIRRVKEEMKDAKDEHQSLEDGCLCLKRSSFHGFLEVTAAQVHNGIYAKCVVVISLSLDMLTNSCLGGIMVSLIFLEGLDEEALLEFMIPKGVCQNAENIAVPRWDSGQLHRNSEGYSRRI
ncbi:hypothetical protein Tco_1525225, partial [Tanacetum coccineum]